MRPWEPAILGCIAAFLISALVIALVALHDVGQAQRRLVILEQAVREASSAVQILKEDIDWRWVICERQEGGRTECKVGVAREGGGP